jgi:Ca-activated chloride channel family protein
MRFGNPAVLLLIPLLVVLALWDGRRGMAVRARIAFSRPEGTENPLELRAQMGLRILGLLLLVLVLARPQRTRLLPPDTAPATDIMLCLDISDSMRSLDFTPADRLGAALEVLRRFVADRPADRLGLTLFAAEAVTQCPLTLDHNALLTALDNVRIGLVDESRTAVGDGLAAAVARLRKSAAKSKVVVLLTDGRANAGAVDPETAARAAAALGVRVHTVGAGAPGGGLMPVEDPFFGKRLVRLPQNELDEATLGKVAALTGGRYFRAKDLEGLKSIYAEIDRLEKTDVAVPPTVENEDLYFPLLLAAFLTLGLNALAVHTWWRRLP